MWGPKTLAKIAKGKFQNPNSKPVADSHKELLHKHPKSKILLKSLDFGFWNFNFRNLGFGRGLEARFR